MKATALLELMKMEKRTGKYSIGQLAEQEAIVLSFRNYTNEAPKNLPSKPTIEPQVIEKKPVVELNADVQLLVNAIKAEMDAIDDEKSRLANKMADIADNINCADIVAQIKALRGKWVQKNDLFWYVKTHGEMPEVQSIERPINLPNDKFELNKMLLNTRSNLSKYRSRLRDAKTEVNKQHYQKQIRISENLISEIDLKMTVV